MRLIIIRHADPNYDTDSLTFKGVLEAICLRNRLRKIKITNAYQSPFGRAQQTANISLNKKVPLETKEWLKEFLIDFPNKPNENNHSIIWDWLPKDWSDQAIFYDKDNWYNHPLFQEINVKSYYDEVVNGLDDLLAQHHYVRNKHLYSVETEDSETIVLFCHLGVECVILSHLLNVSPMILWHNMCVLTSSVTELYSEEREQGIASFRMSCFSDTSHLFKFHLKPNFAARFCEMFKDKTRH